MKYQKIKSFIKSNRIIYSLLFPLLYFRKISSKLLDYEFNRSYDSFFKVVVEGSLVLKMPDFRGSFEIDYRSHILKIILRYKNYEPNLVRLLEKHVDPSKDAIDVGANIGLFTVLLSKLISENNRVLSIEPSPTALTYLYRNLIRNNVKNSVIAYEGVAINKVDHCKLNVIPGMEEYSSLGQMVHPHIKDSNYIQIDVKGEPIDDMVNFYSIAPGFIKVDTEGAEYLVFSGALKTIQEYKPIIVSEIEDRLLSSFGDNSGKVLNLLRENGYKIINANKPEEPIDIHFNGEILAIPY